ncbi:hypothetical protein [Comamonas thiooxydans]|uniref:hypothetical protein n=1 Tax=Comamonas thiooxydans TaxID=363952 RepID=UPI0021145C98|nr:hypothetical protein [Comamonas thiooxydans]UUE95397.1 hypothetical protein MJ608_07090 [Comamonas thiooxydans]
MNSNTIATAVRLLREAAEELSQGVSINGTPDWANEPETHAAYLEHLDSAAALESMSSQCLHQIQEPAKSKLLEAKPAIYTAIAEHDGDWIPLPEYSAQTSDGVLQRVLTRAREEGYQGGNALERLKELGWAYRPVYFAVDPAQVAPLPLLIRDIARDHGITALEACQALKDLGNFSVNTAVTAEMAAKLRELFPVPQAAPAAVAVPDGLKLVPVDLTPEMKREFMDLLMDGIDIYVNRRDQIEIQTDAPRRIWKAVLALAPSAPADALATATGLPAQAVPLKLIEAINTACGGNEWQGDALAIDLLQPACRAIASLEPQAQADARDAVLAHLAGLLDDAAAHIYPSDLNKFQTGEHTATVASVRMGNSSECSVPLYSREQVVEAFNANRAAQGEEA